MVSELIGNDLEVTSDKELFAKSVLPRINYSDETFETSLQVVPHGLLNENGINDSIPESFVKDGVFYLFPGKGIFGSDIFAGAFYLLSRYEEYIITERDEHNRFIATNSILFKNDQLLIPVVDVWMSQLERELTTMFPKLGMKEREFQFEMTFDIDNAYAYSGKGLVRNFGGLFRDLFNGYFGLVWRRLKTLTGFTPDPYDHYAYLTKILSRYEVLVRWFIPVGDRSTYDKNLAFDSERYRRLIRKLARIGNIGVHPSYVSNSNVKILSKEVNRLKTIIGHVITRSRQHFLKIEFPVTYRNLEGRGIIHDYSMGYPHEPGFRAGTGRPFIFYDLLSETTTKVRVHPFAYMDGTFRDYKNVSPEDAMITVKELIENVKSVQGEFICIWHNDSVSDLDKWKGWRQVFEYTLEQASYEN